MTSSELRAIIIALDELEAYVGTVGVEDEAHARQAWAIQKLQNVVARERSQSAASFYRATASYDESFDANVLAEAEILGVIAQRAEEALLERGATRVTIELAESTA